MQSRRLAAIMFTDIVGYTSLMAKDEKRAFQILHENRRIHKTLIHKYKRKKAGEYLNKTGEALGNKGVTVTTEVRVGSAADEIVKLAEEINASFIAMSTHGRSGLSRWAFGSITDKVLRHGGRIPVAVVKALK